MINDFKADGNLWEIVVPRASSSDIQSVANDIQNQSDALKFTLNRDKYKEVRSWV